MPPSPQTPSKVDDGIERVKQLLSAKWGIRFPARANLPTTPSKRDLSLAEEKISSLIQFLYYRERGALDHAIEQFEQNAFHIKSQWRFKPHGEPDVLPSLARSQSALRQDFLKRRPVFSPQETIELTECLRDSLKKVVDRVKVGEKFPACISTEGSSATLSQRTRLRLCQITQLPKVKSPKSITAFQSLCQIQSNGSNPKADRNQQFSEVQRLTCALLIIQIME